MFCQYCLNVRNLYACGTLADINVLVTTEGFMSEVRSRSVPVLQVNGRPTVAVTDKRNSWIFIRSKTPLYLVMTYQSAPSIASVPTLPSSCFFKILTGTAPKFFQSQPTHPSTGHVLSRGESTPHISALVQCTLKMALKPGDYITLLMWPLQPETTLNHPYNLVCIGKILLLLLLKRFGLE